MEKQEGMKGCLLSACLSQHQPITGRQPANFALKLSAHARVTGGGDSAPDGGCGEATPSTVARGSRGTR